MSCPDFLPTGFVCLQLVPQERSEAWDDCNMTGVCDRQQFNDKEKKYVELSDRVELLVGQVIPLKQAYVPDRLVMPENYCRPQPFAVWFPSYPIWQ